MRASRRQTALNYAILTVLAVAVLYPLLGIASLAFQAKGNFTLDTLQRTWDVGQFGSGLLNSMIVASSATILTLTSAILAGYAFGALRLRFASLLFYLFLAGLIVPREAYSVPLYYELRSLGLIDTLPGLILPLSAQILPFGIFWMTAAFRSMPPALIDAAKVDGAGSGSVFRYVALPLVVPAVVSLGVLTFLWSWNDFLLTLLVISSNDLRTAPLRLALFVGPYQSDLSALAAGALIVSIPVVVVYVIFQRRLIRGLMDGAVKE